MQAMIVLLVVFGLASETPTAADNFWTRSLPVVEREPQPRELLAYPTDGKAVALNPPGFCWTPNDQAKLYPLEVRLNRNVRYVCDGGFLCRTMNLLKLVSPISMPKWRSSPWILAAPHDGFSRGRYKLTPRSLQLTTFCLTIAS